MSFALVFLQEVLDEIIGDRHFGRGAEDFVVYRAAFGADHLAQFVFAEPSGFFQLFAVQIEIFFFGARRASDHQGVGVGPGLRRVIEDLFCFDGESSFFPQFAAHGFFQRFARLHEACRRGIESWREGFLSSEEGFVVHGGEHNHDGIGAREDFRAAFFADFFIACFFRAERMRAISAEARRARPEEEGAGLRGDGEVGGREGGLEGEVAQIVKVSESCERSVFFGVWGVWEGEGEVGVVLGVESEEDGVVIFGDIEESGVDESELGFIFSDDEGLFFPEREDEVFGVGELFGDPYFIAAFMGGAVEGVSGECGLGHGVAAATGIFFMDRHVFLPQGNYSIEAEG